MSHKTDVVSHCLYIEHDAMCGCEKGCYDIEQAFRDVKTIDSVKVFGSERDLPKEPYLLYYRSGKSKGFAEEHRNAGFPDDYWQVYLLEAHSRSREDDGTKGFWIFGETHHYPNNRDEYNEALCIVYTGTVENAVRIDTCDNRNLKIDTASRAVVLHELGHAFNLEDANPLGIDHPMDCKTPVNAGVMIHHHLSFLAQDGYNRAEIDSLTKAGRP